MSRLLHPLSRNFSSAFKSFHTSTEVLPPVDSMWRHYKGGYYRIEGYAIREGDTKLQILYTDYYQPGPLPWVRPFKEWNEKVNHSGALVTRFSYISPK